MIDPQRQTQITYDEQFGQSAADTDLPTGFVRYHTQNFCKYFQVTPEGFQDKSVLETGAGPGKHAAVLHLLGAHVTAVDLLESNVRAIEHLKAAHSFENMAVHRYNLMQPLPEQWPRFDLISSHNWLQHTENPGRVLENLVNKLEMRGRLYISTYQSGTFRFFINQIARSVLRWNDREVVKTLIPYFYPVGFLEFENPDDIGFENVFDDFFVPYMWTYDYEPLVRFLNGLGCEVLTPHTGHQRLYEIDNEPLRMGFIKTSESARQGHIEYRKSEFETSEIKQKGHRELIAESVKWALRSIDLLQGTPDQDVYTRAAFCLGLYRLRGMFSLRKGVEERHEALQVYLKQFVDGDTRSMLAWDSSKRHYARQVG